MVAVVAILKKEGQVTFLEKILFEVSKYQVQFQRNGGTAMS